MTDSNDLVLPPAASENAHLKNMEEYQTMYQKVLMTRNFWAEVAEEFHWYSNGMQSVDITMIVVKVQFLSNGLRVRNKLCYNCVDRHLETRADKTAIIWEGNELGEDAEISYRLSGFQNSPMS